MRRSWAAITRLRRAIAHNFAGETPPDDRWGREKKLGAQNLAVEGRRAHARVEGGHVMKKDIRLSKASARIPTRWMVCSATGTKRKGRLALRRKTASGKVAVGIRATTTTTTPRRRRAQHVSKEGRRNYRCVVIHVPLTERRHLAFFFSFSRTRAPGGLPCAHPGGYHNYYFLLRICPISKRARGCRSW